MNNQQIAPQTDTLDLARRCQLSHIKGNGHTYYDKQNYRCKLCGRQFVLRESLVDDTVIQLICRPLLEKKQLARHLPRFGCFALPAVQVNAPSLQSRSL